MLYLIITISSHLPLPFLQRSPAETLRFKPSVIPNTELFVEQSWKKTNKEIGNLAEPFFSQRLPRQGKMGLDSKLESDFRYFRTNLRLLRLTHFH